jgi:hypothetical protein
LGNFLGVCGMHHIFWHLFGHVDPYTTGPFHPFPTLNSVLTSLHSMLCCVSWCQKTIYGNRQMFGLNNFLLFTHNIPFFYIILNFFERPSEMMNLVLKMPNNSNRTIILKNIDKFSWDSHVRWNEWNGFYFILKNSKEKWYFDQFPIVPISHATRVVGYLVWTH